MSFYWNNNNLQWKTVDARGADGLLHYGRVIDCAEEGLIIDFGDGKSPQQVPFGQIYRCKLERFKNDYSRTKDNLPVDALLRLRRDEPAKWYPGVFLTGNFELFGAFALVRITTPDGTYAEVVPGERVRRRRSAEGLGEIFLEKGQFAKEEIQLPDGVSSGSPSPGPYKTASADRWVLDRFSTNCSEHWMAATHVDGSVLHVLKITDQFRRKFDRDYRSSCPKLEGDTLSRMLGGAPPSHRKRPNDERNAMTKRVASSPCSTPTSSESSASITAQLGSPLDGSSARSPVCQSTPTAETPPHQPPSASRPARAGVKRSSSNLLSLIPREVLAEILQCLDGLPQAKLRRVCSTWNQMLTLLHMSRMFRVSDEHRLYGAIGPRACLLKRWTAQTKIIVYRAIVNTGSIFDADVGGRFAEQQYNISLLCTGRFFHCIFQEKHLPRLDKLLLGNLAWQWREYRVKETFRNFVNHIRTELNCFASVCHSLVLKKVTVVLSGDKAPVVVRFTDARIAGEMSVSALWDWMDKSLPPLSQEDVACWTERMSDNSDDKLLGQLVEILNERQSADPRVTSKFRGKKWTRKDLAKVDLKKFSRITAHSLVKTCCYEKLILVLNC